MSLTPRDLETGFTIALVYDRGCVVVGPDVFLLVEHHEIVGEKLGVGGEADGGLRVALLERLVPQPEAVDHGNVLEVDVVVVLDVRETGGVLLTLAEGG
jgi:hypothetical protein